MEFSDRFNIKSPSNKVWEFLWDLPRIGACLPGCESIEQLDSDTYKAVIKQNIGPFKVSMPLLITLEEITPMQRIVLSGRGEDRSGIRMKLNRAELTLYSSSPEESEVAYVMDLTLLGPMIAMGYPVINRKANEMRTEFTQKIIAELSGYGS